MENKSTDVLIIGAGAAGLASLHECRKRGREALCIEAHHSPGGCAGYFSRGGFTFDAGATTLSGMEFNGPLQTFLDDHNLKPELQKIDPGLVILKDEKRLQRFSSNEKWILEQERHFPNQDIRSMWEKLHELNRVCWDLAPASADWPPQNPMSLVRLISQKTPSKIKILPLLLKTFDQEFLKGKNFSSDYLSLIDEQLLISTQSTAKVVPGMMGVMGLCYLEDTWYPTGGMKGFFTTLLTPVKEQVLFQCKAETIAQERNGYLVKTSKGHIKAKTIISTIPIWKTDELFGTRDHATLENEGWGALTAYYKIKLKKILPSLYYQVHSPVSFAGSHSVFLSFSSKDDVKRCKDGHQTLTMSTHITLEAYHSAIQNGRENIHHTWNSEFETAIRKLFGEDLIDLQNVGIGDPDTFEHFTLRKTVGGLPHTQKRNFLNYPKATTKWKQVFQSGDTTFPGQGIVGVIQGVRNLRNRL